MACVFEKVFGAIVVRHVQQLFFQCDFAIKIICLYQDIEGTNGEGNLVCCEMDASKERREENRQYISSTSLLPHHLLNPILFHLLWLMTKEGKFLHMLPNCHHVTETLCIDVWLCQHANNISFVCQLTTENSNSEFSDNC